MSAKEDILNLMNDYCYAIDSGDMAKFGNLLQHAEWIAEGVRPGKESQSNLIIYTDGTPRTKHTLSNINIEVDDTKAHARAHSYVVVYQQTTEFPLQAIFAGEYFDEFDRVDGTWRFTKREIRHSLVGDMTAHLKNPSLTIPSAPSNA